MVVGSKKVGSVDRRRNRWWVGNRGVCRNKRELRGGWWVGVKGIEL